MKKERTYPVREGKRAVTVYVPIETWRQLRLLALAEDSNLQGLMLEAIELLLQKHGRFKMPARIPTKGE